MSNAEEILVHAWGKDSDNLRDAVDSYMTARANEHIANLTADVAARMFGNQVADEDMDVSTGEEVPYEDQESEYEDQPDLEEPENAEEA